MIYLPGGREKLKKHFDVSIFGRGLSYYNQKRVDTFRAFPAQKDKIEIRGEITGSDAYNASFVFDLRKGEFSGFDCTCPYYDNCKHSVALGLEFLNAQEEFEYDFEDFLMQMSPDDIKRDLIVYINDNPKAEKYGLDDCDNIAGTDYKNLSREALLGELKIMLSGGDVSQEEIDNVVQELASRVQKDGKNIQVASEVDGNVNGSRQRKFVLESPDLNIEDYAIYLDLDSYSGKIYDMEIKKNDFSVLNTNSETLLSNCVNLSESRKELLKILGKFNHHHNNNYQKIIGLLKESGLKVYLKGTGKNKELKFLPEDKIEKIKASLVFECEASYYGDRKEKKFIFRLDDSYKNKKNSVFLFDDNGIAQIDNGAVSYHNMPNFLIKLISRIQAERNKYNYEHSNHFETALEEDETININKIISESAKYLDLTSKFKPNFNIKKSTQSEPCILVDYDSKKDLLEISAAIDYDCDKVNVKNSVKRYRNYNGKDKFERYGSDKYIITVKLNEKNVSYATINKKKEISLFKHFYTLHKEYGFKKSLQCRHEGEKSIFRYFKKYWENIEKLKYKIHYTRDKFSFAKEDFKADFEVDLNAENDWLKFDVDCYCGQDKLTLKDLQDYINNKKDYIKTKDGTFLKVTNREELERFVMMLESFYVREQGGFEGKLYHAPELEGIFTSSKYYNAKVEASFNNFIKEIKSGKPVRKIRLPVKFDKILRDYQKEGIDWFYFLRKYRFAGILADDMGFGKTLQSLVLVSKEKVKGKPSVVICPKTLLYNWKLEAEKFVPNLKTVVIDGTPTERKALIDKANEYDLVITGYATMQRDWEIYEKTGVNFNYCILDEAQFIKNHTTKSARIVKKINADYRLALTGTPLENNVSEIWSIFDFLMPGFLGPYSNFVKKFKNPIMNNGNRDALGHLRKKVECFMLRRTKDKVLKELPPKIEQVSHCQLTKDQNILYQEVLANVKSEIFNTVREKGFEKSRIHILAGLIKLRQVCNHPVLLLKDNDYTKYQSAKLDMFLELIEEIVESKRKVLVFSQFTKMIDILAKELEKRKINYNYLSGKTKKRQELVQDFNENELKQVFLISLKAGGTGLNLTSADNVIIFDPWWNPSVENQAIDRTHRIGQKNSVNVYRLITSGTIEDRIVKLQEKKKFLFDNLVGESKDLFTKLTWEEIQGLFNVKEN